MTVVARTHSALTGWNNRASVCINTTRGRYRIRGFYSRRTKTGDKDVIITKSVLKKRADTQYHA